MQANSAFKSVSDETVQPSKLLPELFHRLDDGKKVSVLHIGPACNDTLNFFSDYRCNLYFADLFAELPLQEAEEGPTDYQSQIERILQLPEESCFDICLFWDVFNYLNKDAIDALLQILAPHLWEDSLAHAFSVHNPRAAVAHNIYGIRDTATLSLRARTAHASGYAPHSQRQLTEALHCFNIERSVLLADSRLELLLQVKRPSRR